VHAVLYGDGETPGGPSVCRNETDRCFLDELKRELKIEADLSDVPERSCARFAVIPRRKPWQPSDR